MLTVPNSSATYTTRHWFTQDTLLKTRCISRKMFLSSLTLLWELRPPLRILRSLRRTCWVWNHQLRRSLWKLMPPKMMKSLTWTVILSNNRHKKGKNQLKGNKLKRLVRKKKTNKLNPPNHRAHNPALNNCNCEKENVLVYFWFFSLFNFSSYRLIMAIYRRPCR